MRGEGAPCAGADRSESATGNCWPVMRGGSNDSDKGAGSGPRLRAHRLTSAGKDRPQARRLNAAGFSFAVVGRGELLMLLLPFKAMLLSERARGRKSGSPPLFAPFFKVQRNTAHIQSSGFAAAPRSKASTRAGL